MSEPTCSECARPLSPTDVDATVTNILGRQVFTCSACGPIVVRREMTKAERSLRIALRIVEDPRAAFDDEARGIIAHDVAELRALLEALE